MFSAQITEIEISVRIFDFANTIVLLAFIVYTSIVNKIINHQIGRLFFFLWMGGIDKGNYCFPIG